MTRYALIIYILFSGPIVLQAQGDYNEMNLPLSVYVPQNDIGESGSGRNYLQAKLEEYVSSTGPAEQLDAFSFLVLPRISIISQDITANAPQMYLIDLEMTCFVTNVKPPQEGEERLKSIIFNSSSFTLRGVGRTKDQALMNAYRGVSKSREKLEKFFVESRTKIVLYFKANCDAMIGEAEMLAKEANLSVNYGSVPGKANAAELKFASGLNILKNIRIANTECYEAQSEKVDHILSMYDDFACNYYLALAKNHWAKRDVETTIEFLDRIPPSYKCKAEMEVLLKEIAAYTDDPERNIDNKIKLWEKAGGLDKAKLELEAYKFLQMDTREARRIDAKRITNKDLLILK